MPLKHSHCISEGYRCCYRRRWRYHRTADAIPVRVAPLSAAQLNDNTYSAALQGETAIRRKLAS
jgi:hypothetical protein